MTLELDIAGMTCDGCVRNVKRALERVAGPGTAKVDLATHSASVQSGDAAIFDRLLTAVDDAGYSASRKPADER